MQRHSLPVIGVRKRAAPFGYQAARSRAESQQAGTTFTQDEGGQAGVEESHRIRRYGFYPFSSYAYEVRVLSSSSRF